MITRLDGHLLLPADHADHLLELLDLLGEVLRHDSDELRADIADRFGPGLHGWLVDALDVHAKRTYPAMIEKLQGHYGFTRTPFGRDLAPGMLHRHAAHNEAVARISWCISERSIGVVTGEVGAGKTVSVRTVLAGLDPSRHTVIYLPNPLIGVRGIHEEIVGAFGQVPSHLGSRLITQTGKALLAEREERGRTPVLVLDEAHLLTYEQLETIRMLTNQGMDQDSPLACLLVGQPTLRRTMKLAVLAALEQRTALRYTMPA